MPTSPVNIKLSTNGGEMALRSKALDWGKTLVGSAGSWPDTLRSMVRMILHAKFPMFVLWGKEHICFYNDGYISILGKRHPSALGLPYRQVWPEIWDQIHPLIESAYSGEAVLHHNLPLDILRNDVPETAYFSFSYSPIFDGPGDIVGMLCVCTETTEQVIAEQVRKNAAAQLANLNVTLEQRILTRTAELEALHEQLRQSQKLEALGSLTGGVAHDFNNTLQVISGNLQLMRRDTRDNAYLHGRLNAAMAGVERGAKLSSQLLSFARRQPLQPVVLNSGKLITSVGEMLRRAIGEMIELETVVSGGLWNIHVDKNQLENALLNLSLNARDAINGPGRLTIETCNASLDSAYARAHSEVTAGQYVLIAVSDTGKGMSAETMSHVFEPFFTTKPEGHGTGLGLSMVYGFVKQSGGHIKVYSEVGHGTTIKIYLPRSLEGEYAESTVFTGPVVGGDETVLVVEDDPQVRDTVVAMLSELGYKVFRAPDAASALVILESGVPVDLLFTDVVMPGELRSPELARCAVVLQPGIKVLFTSGYTENGIVHHGRLDQGVQLLTKPYRQEELARKIRDMFASPKHARQSRETFSRAETQASAKAAMPPLDILVVEDNFETLQVSMEILTQFGHSATGASSAEDALAFLAKQNFDLLITDVTLPHMSGLELAKLAQQDRAIQIVFASGHARPADAAADTMWLQKPFGFDQLQDLLAEISRHRSRLLPSS